MMRRRRHVMGARVGAERVGAGPGRVVSVLFAWEDAQGSGRRVPWRDRSVAGFHTSLVAC
eukprot:44673-Prymnesium_polylepis.1